MILRLCFLFWLFTTPCSSIQIIPRSLLRDLSVEPSIYESDALNNEQGFFDFDNFYNKFVYDLLSEPVSSNKEKIVNYDNQKDIINTESKHFSSKKTKIK
ncbi:Hypothetical protein SRAE_X000078100 [Strongyloides ratti]|uniref:Uncharacterized protein n=1 Tax=Strongyloides ratti TaxID=34506 RepID=A0A090LNW0_STRRB|nr:Hypothetical protein SRAE_X000078100 [Strongyloides ratti]CEF71456.1 Hypothetical protein SRAE_X000078100 [Strongyloides ratti]